VSSPPGAGTDGAYGVPAESDDGAGGGGASMVLICAAAGAGLLVIVGGWIVWRQCCGNKPSSSQDVTVVLDASAPPGYNAGRSHPAPSIYNSATGVGQYHGAAPPVYEEPVALNPVLQGPQAVFNLQPANEIQAAFDYDHVQQNGRDDQPAPPAYPQSQLQPGNQPVPIYVDAPDGGNQM